MNEQQGESYKDRSVWLRGLFMLGYVFLMGVAKFVTLIVVILQFLSVLFTAEKNINLLQFGKSLSVYQYQVVLYLTYNSEIRPFPIGEWPEKSSDI
ncbi:MAG: DUF4389 domain-containing protein [Psychromonas sp.]